MSGPLTAIDRRRVLTSAGILALLAVAPACGAAPIPPPADALEAQRLLALHDSELAAAAGTALSGPDDAALATALAQVSLERADHARALATEISRASGRPTPETSQTSTPADAPDAPAPTVSQVVNALRAAADSSGKLAISSSGYRAGLLASIAASCTAAYAIALAVQS